MAFGLVIGSFLNVVIHRLPRRQSLALPPSHCPTCGHRLGPTELVPVLSYLWQRGRCRACGERISPRYPAVELATAALFALAGFRFGLSPAAVVAAVFLAFLLAAAAIDLEHRLLPNTLNLAGLVGGLILVLVGWVDWRPALLGLGLLGGIMLLVVLLSRGGMGAGDFKFAAVLGFFLGPAPGLVALFLAVIAGGLWGAVLLLLRRKGRRDSLAFGPFLALGGAVALFWGGAIAHWYGGGL